MTNWHKEVFSILEELAKLNIDSEGYLHAKIEGLNAFTPMGEWDASGGTQPPATQVGQFWWISEPGVIDGVDYNVHDWIVCVKVEPTKIFKKLDNSDMVTSVEGRTGNVLLKDSDIYMDGSEMYLTSFTRVRNIENTPPPHSENHIYIVGSSPVGEWEGHENQLVISRGEEWVFITPRKGWIACLTETSETQLLKFNGTSWENIVTSVQHNELENLEWSVSGHSIDEDLDLEGNSIVNVNVITGSGSSAGIESSTDIDMKLPDSIGSNKFNIKNSSNNIVASIDSLGNISTSGYVDGVDISSHASNVDAHHSKSHAHDGVDGSGTVEGSNIKSTGEDSGLALISDGSGNSLWDNPTDENAIHDNVANEFSAITEKTSPVNADLLLLEDSADSYNKKKVQAYNLAGRGYLGYNAGDFVYSAGGNTVGMTLDGTTRFYLSATRSGAGSGTTSIYVYFRVPPDFHSFYTESICLLHRRTGTISATITMYKNGTADSGINGVSMSPGTSFGVEKFTPTETYTTGDEVLIKVDATLENGEAYALAGVCVGYKRRVTE